LRSFKISGNNITTGIAILAIMAMEITALVKGVDGALLGIAIAAVSGLGGYYLRRTLME
jgi:hypothetical protein